MDPIHPPVDLAPASATASVSVSVSVSDSPADSGHSRRALLGAGASGLALALLARHVSRAAAQDATPAAEGGMPPGVALVPLTNVPIPGTDVPAAGFTLSIYRVTLEPGSAVPASTTAYPSLGFAEAGTLTCPGGAPRFVIAADGAVREVGEGDITVNTGEAIYVPPNVLDGAGNIGTDLLSVLVVDLVPLEEMATPAA